jgi:hypothetical protein
MDMKITKNISIVKKGENGIPKIYLGCKNHLGRMLIQTIGC